MKFPKFVTAALIAGAVASAAACGSSDSDVPPVPTTTAAATSAATGAGSATIGNLTNPNQRPSVATLNAMLNKALDPNTPNAEKVNLVEGAEKDPQVFTKLVQARQENPEVTFEIFPPVIPAGPN